MIRKVLIANRGEIAVRIARTLREMGIASVAAFSDADRDALFVQVADEAYHLGRSPASESYLNIENLLRVARDAKVDAIHPGYGFLAENADFAASVLDANLAFIGPRPEAIRLMGNKVAARKAVSQLGVPTVPGTAGPVRSLREALQFARAQGYPVAVKASGGGGGRGIRVVRTETEMQGALESASREAKTYFRNADVYLEKYFDNPRHVEVQVLADGRGGAVHLGERDCSIQRRHQKLIEETPSPAVKSDVRRRMGEMALRAAEAANYHSAGTVEFLLNQDGEFFFLEMNTRIQVEHPVTEMVTGIDLIREMVLIADRAEMTVTTSSLEPFGHAIEVRVNAEDAIHGFRPSATQIIGYREPGGIGVRVDTGVYQGFTIPEYYDSLIAKVISWGPHRMQAVSRMQRALNEFKIDGPSTTLPFASAILGHPVFVEGMATTAFVGDCLDDLLREMPDRPEKLERHEVSLKRLEGRTFDVEVNRRYFRVEVSEVLTQTRPTGQKARGRRRRAPEGDGALTSPMHGTILSIKKRIGDEVMPGETLFVIEAMKMENEISADVGGTLQTVHVHEGQIVEQGEPLAVIA